MPGMKDEGRRMKDEGREATSEFVSRPSSFFLLLFSSIFPLLLAGCFETQFQFHTVVHPDGSVIRETRVEGRGAHLFKLPEGGGWESQSWESRGEEALIPDTYYHGRARGRFAPGQEIPPDYELDIAKQEENWAEKKKARFEKAGIQPPFEEHLFSRNQIQVSQVKGWLTLTTFYEETFLNAGVIPVLLTDLKEEIRRQGENRGEVFQDSEIDVMAKLRLEDEILPEVRFESEVSLPGKIVSTSGRRAGKGKVEWKFTMKDFSATNLGGSAANFGGEEQHSQYTLRAASRSLRPAAVVILAAAAVLLALFAFLNFWGMRLQKRPKKRRPQEPGGSGRGR